MQLNDRTVKGITIGFLFLYVAVLIAGMTLHQLLLLVCLLNAVTGLLVVSYWIWDKMRPLKSVTEQREIIVLLVEVLVLVFSLYAIFAKSLRSAVVILQYSIFGVHAILLLLFIIFMFTFKIKKLF